MEKTDEQIIEELLRGVEQNDALPSLLTAVNDDASGNASSPLQEDDAATTIVEESFVLCEVQGSRFPAQILQQLIHQNRLKILVCFEDASCTSR